MTENTLSSRLHKINQLSSKLQEIDYEISNLQYLKKTNTNFYEVVRADRIKNYSIFTFAAFTTILLISYFYITPKYISINFFYYTFFALFFSFCLTYIAYNVYLLITYNYVSSQMSKYTFEEKLNALSVEKKTVYTSYINLLFNENKIPDTQDI